MNSLKKLGLTIGLMALGACASHQMNTADSLSLTPNARIDCSAFRCAACPTGQHPALTPPDCCRCD
jgi:hypothetical protein